MPHIRVKLEHYLTCGRDDAVVTAGSEEMYGIVLELSDDMSDKADF